MVFHQISNSKGNYNYNANIYKGIVFGSHFHGNYELIYSISGTAEITVNGKETKIKKGEFLLISPYSIHSLITDKNSEIWVGVFSKDFVSDFASKNKYNEFLPFKCDIKVENLLKEYLFYENKPEHYMCIACLNAMCSECLKNAKIISRKSESEFAERVIKYISENLIYDITLKRTADALGYEYHYFSSLFHSCFEINFKRFINLLRFEYACTIITDKSKSITNISDECGFDTVRNFNRVFKEIGGCTPSEYRKNLFKS